jgi:hypothetical protein
MADIWSIYLFDILNDYAIFYVFYLSVKADHYMYTGWLTSAEKQKEKF